MAPLSDLFACPLMILFSRENTLKEKMPTMTKEKKSFTKGVYSFAGVHTL